MGFTTANFQLATPFHSQLRDSCTGQTDRQTDRETDSQLSLHNVTTLWGRRHKNTADRLFRRLGNWTGLPKKYTS